MNMRKKAYEIQPTTIDNIKQCIVNIITYWRYCYVLQEVHENFSFDMHQ